ncbi:MAG: undecaprenyl-phosphate glucose phosphotransferase [Candidatus Omnitrophota bacterium]|nr:undecaprenyl-phosphate glucose phosphotransferase [Candidatus Omnitrophota bacterium]
MSRLKHQGHFSRLAVVSDLVAVLISLVIAYLFRFYSVLDRMPGTAPAFIDYAKALAIIVPVYLLSFREYGLYAPQRHRRRIEEMFQVAKAVSLACVALMAVTFVYRGFSYSRVYLVMLWALSIFFSCLGRYYLIQWEYHRKFYRKNGLSRVLIVGANRNARNMIQWARNNPHYGEDVVGVLAREEELIGKHIEGAPVVGVLDQTEEYIENLQPDEVLLMDNQFSRERIAELVFHCENRMIDIKIAADFYGLMTKNLDVEYISSVPLLGFRQLPLEDPWNRATKRGFDIVVSAVMLIATSPIWIVVALATLLDDGSPILYRQERMGRDSKSFDVLKFRTMKKDAEKETGPVWADANDLRRTRIGQFLRRWNLDELPQLWNVLKGDMSLVGPRPERPHFIEQFREEIPRYMTRHKIKSGLTGWAAVNGYRGNTSIAERTKYDLYYIENWSLIFDIEILIMTLFAFKNAY